MRAGFWITTCAGCAVAGAVLAHGGATGIVKERMELMKSMGAQMKTMGQMAQGQTPYRAATFAQAAEEISAQSGDELVALFPQGSLHPPTEAVPAIWTDLPRFSQLADRMQAQARALAAMARDSQGVPKAEFRALAQSCAACHEDYCLRKD